jgi:hypothetical protein
MAFNVAYCDTDQTGRCRESAAGELADIEIDVERARGEEFQECPVAHDQGAVVCQFRRGVSAMRPKSKKSIFNRR